MRLELEISLKSQTDLRKRNTNELCLTNSKPFHILNTMGLGNLRVVELQLRVASYSCELRAASCELRVAVASCELQLRVASCSCELQLRVASCSCELRVARTRK